jgi:hypothetical protein
MSGGVGGGRKPPYPDSNALGGKLLELMIRRHRILSSLEYPSSDGSVTFLLQQY